MAPGARAINSDDAPKPVGPYSHAVVSGGFVFLSGQIGLDPATGKLVSDEVRAQADAALRNLSSVLRSAGIGIESVVKVCIYLKDIDDFASVNEVYGRYFSSWKPARTTVGGLELPKGALVEIDAVARADG